MAIKCKRVAKYDEVHDGGVGTFAWGLHLTWNIPVLYIWLPDGVTSLLVSTDPSVKKAPDGATIWHWDGNKDAPTLKPSILNPSEGGWHGFLTAGELA